MQIIFVCPLRANANNRVIVTKKKRSFTEWLNDFIEADAAYYDQMEADDWDPSHDHHDTMPGGDADYFDEEIDDGILESLLIVGLAAVLAALVYYRQQRQAEARRRQEQEVNGGNVAVAVEQVAPVEGQQADGGFFPQPGDPQFLNWAAGGVGH